jgi:predicted nucleic-acid-binding protein
MISVDTNVLVRLLTRDDKRQFRRAYALMESTDVFIADTVILETEWVLRYGYDFAPEDICDALSALCGLENVNLGDPQAVADALDWHRQGVDFADALHLAKSRSCATLYTFDKAFASRAHDLCNCEVMPA